MPYCGKRFWTHQIPTSCLKMLPTIWHTYMKLVTKYQIPVINSCLEKCFLFANFVDFNRHCTYMLIFRRILLSHYWWQKSDIWSQASYRYPILWEAFLDPSDWNLTGPKTLPTIWHTYMKLVTKYQIPVINSYWEKCAYRYPISWEAFLNPSDSYFLFADFVDFYTHLTYITRFQSFRGKTVIFRSSL
jgi:hypothetical protein